MDPAVNSNHTGPWTNEKHLHYLNSMEAAFVRTMLENNHRHLRLDRHLPDSSESTLDLKSQRAKKHVTSGSIAGSRTRMNGRTDKKTRRLSSHNQSERHDDQVVPQLERRSGDKDERDPANAAVAVASAAPAS